jgi:hypothetical protein
MVKLVYGCLVWVIFYGYSAKTFYTGKRTAFTTSLLLIISFKNYYITGNMTQATNFNNV